MARTKYTARRRLSFRASPTGIIWEYEHYRQLSCDDVGQFLADYTSLWTAAHAHGVTGYDGIQRLIDRLPSDWTGYARELSGDYIYRSAIRYDLEADLPGFACRLATVFGIYRAAPYGPYLPPRAPIVRVTTTPEWLYREVPGETSPFVPLLLSSVGTHDHEAGPSRPMGQGVSLPRPLLLAPPVPPPAALSVSPLFAPSVPPSGAHMFWPLPPVKRVREPEPVPEDSEEEDPDEDPEQDPEEEEEEDEAVVPEMPYGEIGDSSIGATFEQIDRLIRETNEYLETGKFPGPSYMSDDDYSGV